MVLGSGLLSDRDNNDGTLPYPAWAGLTKYPPASEGIKNKKRKKKSPAQPGPPHPLRVLCPCPVHLSHPFSAVRGCSSVAPPPRPRSAARCPPPALLPFFASTLGSHPVPLRYPFPSPSPSPLRTLFLLHPTISSRALDCKGCKLPTSRPVHPIRTRLSLERLPLEQSSTAKSLSRLELHRQSDPNSSSSPSRQPILPPVGLFRHRYLPPPSSSVYIHTKPSPLPNTQTIPPAINW